MEVSGQLPIFVGRKCRGLPQDDVYRMYQCMTKMKMSQLSSAQGRWLNLTQSHPGYVAPGDPDFANASYNSLNAFRFVNSVGVARGCARRSSTLSCTYLGQPSFAWRATSTTRAPGRGSR